MGVLRNVMARGKSNVDLMCQKRVSPLGSLVRASKPN